MIQINARYLHTATTYTIVKKARTITSIIVRYQKQKIELKLRHTMRLDTATATTYILYATDNRACQGTLYVPKITWSGEQDWDNSTLTIKHLQMQYVDDLPF